MPTARLRSRAGGGASGLGDLEQRHASSRLVERRQHRVDVAPRPWRGSAARARASLAQASSALPCIEQRGELLAGAHRSRLRTLVRGSRRASARRRASAAFAARSRRSSCCSRKSSGSFVSVSSSASMPRSASRYRARSTGSFSARYASFTRVDVCMATRRSASLAAGVTIRDALAPAARDRRRRAHPRRCETRRQAEELEVIARKSDASNGEPRSELVSCS